MLDEGVVYVIEMIGATIVNVDDEVRDVEDMKIFPFVYGVLYENKRMIRDWRWKLIDEDSLMRATHSVAQQC